MPRCPCRPTLPENETPTRSILGVAGTRDSAMSNAIMTHTALLKAGAPAELFVQEGLGHGHFYVLAATPEALTAYDVFSRFFETIWGVSRCPFNEVD